jgi:hypothetical protein
MFGKFRKFGNFGRCGKFLLKIKLSKPGPASAVEKLRTTEPEDPGSTPNEGS